MQKVFVGLVGWLIDWSIDQLVFWLIVWSSRSFIGWSIDWVIVFFCGLIAFDRLVDRVGWLIGFSYLVDWLIVSSYLISGFWLFA